VIPVRLRPLLARWLPHISLPGPLARRVGFASIISSHRGVSALLHDVDAWVPYATRSDQLGLGQFPLALDGEHHVTRRAEIGTVLANSAEQHRHALDAVTAFVDRTVGNAANASIEVVNDLIRPALVVWAQHWFGVTATLAGELSCAADVVTHAMFFNPARPGGRVDHKALAAACAQVERVAQLVDAEVGGAPNGSLLALLHDLHHVDGSSPRGSVSSDVLGLTVGPFTLTAWSIACAVDTIIDRPAVLASLTNRAVARASYFEAMRFSAPLPGIIRQCPHDTGTSQLAVTLIALQDATHYRRPTSFDVHRNHVEHLAFGSGAHRCLGQDTAGDVAGIVLHALARQRPQRVQGSAGQLAHGAGAPQGFTRKQWPFPSTMWITLH
jgi:cytochrome P450